MAIFPQKFNLFGFTISSAKEEEEKQKELEKQKAFSLPPNDDGSVIIQSGAYHGTYVDMEGTYRNDIELITKYRDMSMQPELESAIEDIVNEAIVIDDKAHSVNIVLDDAKIDKSVKSKIEDEFKTVLKLLNFNRIGHELFKKWYIDGRIYFEIIVEEGKEKEGIKELRAIDPRRIRKIREIKKGKDLNTGMEIIEAQQEYFLYNERGIIGAFANMGLRITTDKVIYVPSGNVDAKRNVVLSYLHKSIKPLNQLRMLEDATVIYRLARAPERRLFYIDTGNMSPTKSEEYIKSIMTNYRNKLVYDSSTGEIKDDRKFMSMLEDFWLPRREGGKGTEVSTLAGGENLGKIEDVEYMEKKLYKSLGIPYSRNQEGTGFSMGRTTEITRDELKFSKFIDKLRNKFSTVFDEALRVQLSLKGIATEDEWADIREEIYYDFLKDNNFNELKESELNGIRLQLLAQCDPFVGKYFSKDWVQKHILQLDNEEIEEIDKQIKDETDELVKNPPKIDPQTGLPLTMMAQGQPGQPGAENAPPKEEPEYSDDQIGMGINALNNSVSRLR